MGRRVQFVRNLDYRYKVDAKTRKVLPIVVDAHNHCWDAVRYSYDDEAGATAMLSLFADEHAAI